MAETKTKPTGESVEAHLASRASSEQLADCKAIMAMCKRVTKQQPKMWGPSIVGYGSYTYTYASGHSGDACLTGFAVRGKELVVYLIAEDTGQVELLAKLGRHKMGKACLYFKRLADLDAKVLEALIAGSVAEVKRRYPGIRRRLTNRSTGPTKDKQALEGLLMNVIVFGASGATGRLVVEFAVAAGHVVTAFVRDASRLTVAQSRARVVEGDALDQTSVANALRGQDAVICTLGTMPAGKEDMARRQPGYRSAPLEPGTSWLPWSPAAVGVL